VDAPVAERAVGVVEIVAETARVDAAIAGALRGVARIAAVEGAQRRGAFGTATFGSARSGPPP